MQVQVVNLTKEEIAQIIREIVKQEIGAKLDAKLSPLFEAIAVSQKDVAGLANVSPRTVSAKIANGQLPAFAAEGSRRNFVTLEAVQDLKKRRPRK